MIFDCASPFSVLTISALRKAAWVSVVAESGPAATPVLADGFDTSFKERWFGQVQGRRRQRNGLPYRDSIGYMQRTNRTWTKTGLLQLHP